MIDTDPTEALETRRQRMNETLRAFDSALARGDEPAAMLRFRETLGHAAAVLRLSLDLLGADADPARSPAPEDPDAPDDLGRPASATIFPTLH